MFSLLFSLLMVIFEREFNTHEVYTAWADLIFFLRETELGHIITLTASERGVLGLRESKVFFCDYGSLFTPFLRYNERWIWSFVKGGRTIFETVILDAKIYEKETISNMVYHNNFTVIASGVISRANIDIVTSQSEKSYTTNSKMATLVKFCSEMGAVRQLCDPNHFKKLFTSLSVEELDGKVLVPELTIIVTAGSRPFYLLYTLSRILLAPGCPKENIVVVLGSKDTKVIELLNILGLSFVFITNDQFDGNKSLFSFYKKVFELGVNYFPNSKYFTIIDEDVEVSPDYFSYLNQTVKRLDDPTIYCINSHTLVTDLKQSRGAAYIRRGATQVYWGFVIKKDVALEIVRKWSTSNMTSSAYLYDYWIYNFVRGERECIYPDVGRVRHYGIGFNTHMSNHEFEAWKRPFLFDFGITLKSTADLQLPTYDHHLITNLYKSVKLKSMTPWMEQLPTRGKYLIFFLMEDAEDLYSWYLIASCFGLHMTNEQGHHNGLFIGYKYKYKERKSQNDILKLSTDHEFRINYLTKRYEINPFTNYLNKDPEQIFYFVGFPFSKYSFLYNDSEDLLIKYEEFRDTEISSFLKECNKPPNLYINYKYNIKYAERDLFSIFKT
ncbi:Protein O-linked-mannose beta-1,2-N-acetylglucosaminyltransferase 1 [Armadillidium vulgare]|nr:Protein O-linked-mannose beta-1,2-N-acetylglucosaminyltransferase 1 [Armadillidium vulgare]